eukprot:gene7171-18698_t
MFSRFSSLIRPRVASAVRAQTAVQGLHTTGAAACARPAVSLHSEDEEMLQDAARTFAQSIQPKVAAMDKAGVMDPDLIQGLFDNGFMSIEIPEEYGGIDPAVSAGVDVHNTVVNNTLKFWASDELKEEILPGLATDHFGSFCLSEAGSGSDAFALATTATASADGSYYTIDGQKLWISNAEHAGVFIVFATVDKSAGYKGITAFAVPKELGVEIGLPADKLGIRASSTCPVFFDNIKVPAKYLIGEVGHGYKYAIGILNEGRIGIGAQMVGLAQGCFEQTMPYMWQRKQFGEYIGDFQGMELQYADVAMEIEAARVLVYNAARLKEAGLPFAKEAAMAKLKASRVAELSASKCIEWLGGNGFSKEYPAEKFYRDSKIGAIYEGTSNIQLTTIAKDLRRQYK